MNSNNYGNKPKMNMMTKGPSRKQVIITTSTNNAKRVIENML